MGLFKEMAGWIVGLNLPAGFAVCELGDQQMAEGKVGRSTREFYASLGCGRYESIDANGQGTVLADLNVPLADLGTFDLVTDFGTGEHIFDQAQVWRTLHTLTAPGGFIAFDRPSQGYPKHCFYLTNACLYLDVAAANDYALVQFTKASTPRGILLRGILQRPALAKPFQAPQQGRYHATLQLAGEA